MQLRCCTDAQKTIKRDQIIEETYEFSSLHSCIFTFAYL